MQIFILKYPLISFYINPSNPFSARTNYGHYDDGAKEFLKWVYAGGRKITGLVRRRKLESDLFQGNVDECKSFDNNENYKNNKTHQSTNKHTF